MSWCWGVVSSWLLSPGAAWFLFFNAIVGAVAVLSWGAGAHHQAGEGSTAAALAARRRRLTRSASSMVMERLRSMSTAVFPSFHVQEYNPFQEAEAEAEEIVRLQAVSMVKPDPDVVPMACAAAAAATVERGRKKSEPEKAPEEFEFPFVVCAERCRRAYGDEAEEKAEVNARAERFIRQFRADLKLERINSILLNRSRCAGAGTGTVA